MEKGITFVGLDAHKVAINVCVLLPGGGHRWCGSARMRKGRFAAWSGR